MECVACMKEIKLHTRFQLETLKVKYYLRHRCNQPTNSIELSPSSEANSRSATQEFPSIS
jgi:hypothetical protein